MNFYDFAEIKQRGDCVAFLETHCGVTVDRNGRCPAVWRGGDGPNVAVTAHEWFDHVEKEGGGIIELAAKTRCDGDIQAAQNMLGEWLGLTPKIGLVKAETLEPSNHYERLLANGFTESARYDYTDLDGNVVHYVVRMDHPTLPKEFVQGTPKGWGLRGVTPILYRLADVQRATHVYIAEGEKDADSLAAMGFHATTNAGGAEKWRREYNEAFRGKHVAILRDNDGKGERHAEAVAKDLHGIAASVRVVCPSALPKGDVTDWIQREGGTREKLVDLIEATPEWEPSIAARALARFGNPWARETYGKNKSGETVLTDATLSQPYWAGLYWLENKILFEPDEREYYRYSDGSGLWIPETDAQVQQSISDRLLDESRRFKDREFVARHRSMTTLSAIERQLKGIAEEREAFAQKGKLIACSNGVLDLEADTFSGFDPNYRLRAALSVAFDPSAVCPRFIDQVLKPALPEDDIELLQRFAGLCVLGENMAQRFLIMDGNAGTGKSTIVSIIRSIVGERNCSELRTDCLDSRFELYRIRRSSLLIGSDVPGDFLEKDGARRLKALTGGDPLEAEAKNSNLSFTMEGKFNVLISCNERLRMRVESDAGAWKRRLLIIRFGGRPPDRRIPNLAQLLIREEGSGILNWMLAGARALLAELTETGSMAMSHVQVRRVDDLLSESQSLSVYLDRRVARDHGSGPSSDLSVDELQEGYFDFCASLGWTPQPLRTIQAKLPQLMLEKFGSSKSNSVKRGGRNARGFSRVTFVEPS